MVELRRRRLLAPALVGLATLFAAVAVGSLGALLQIRAQATRAAADLRAEGVAIRALPAANAGARLTREEIQRLVTGTREPATLTGRFGQVVARTGPQELWARGGAHWTGGLATVGTSTRIRDDAVEVVQGLAGGRSIVVRRDLGREATRITGSTALVVGLAALGLALVAALIAYLRARRRTARVDAAAGLVEAMATGRIPSDDQYPSHGELAGLGAPLRAAGKRLATLGEVADRELAVLGAAIEPMPIGVAGRGPSGARLRNLALERLLDDVPADDRAAIDAAIADGLKASGPIGSRVGLRDGRLMEVDGWSVPGGRLVSVAERTEQDRLRHLRRQLESSAVRQLRAPVDEIKTRGKELYKKLPAPAAPTLRAMFAATDRLDRVVRMLLRGTPHDPAQRPPRRETFGVAGFLWGLAHDWDAALRQKALRVELDIASDLPDVQTDPALVEEILTELVDNAAKYTPRGGTVSLAARAGDGNVVLEVRDTGGGIVSGDIPHVTERFFRGQDSESIPGAGLGLGVASALAERLGGRLTVEAGPGGQVGLELPVRPPAGAVLAHA